MTPEQLIAKGPTPEKEVAAAAQATAAQAPAEHKIEDSSTKNVLAAFDKISNKNESVDEANLKKILAEEEAKADDSPKDKLPQDDDDDNKEVQKTPEEKKEDELPKLPPTARPKVADELKGIVPEAALPLLKKMSNDAREYFVAEFKRYGKEVEELKSKLSVAEKQQVKDGLPSGWYEHEEAYLLTPEYKGLSQTKNQLSAIEEHYRKQLIAIKEGEDWFDLALDKAGNIIQQKRKAGPEADMLVSSRLQEAVITLRDLEKQEGALKQAFKQNAVNHRAGMRKLEDEYFPQYADEKEFSANEDAQNFQKILQSYGMQNDRMSGMMTKLYAFALEQVRKVQELEKVKAAPAQTKTVTNKNGPTGDEINKGSVTKTLTPDEVPFNPRAFEEYFK